MMAGPNGSKLFFDSEKPSEANLTSADIFVALHTKYTVNIETIQSLERAGLLGSLRVIRTPFFDRARNDAVQQFLASGCRYLLWVDDDNDVPENIMSLFDRNEPCLAPVNWCQFPQKDRTSILPGVSWWLGEDSMPLVCFLTPPLLRVYQSMGFRWLDGANCCAGGVWAVRRDVFQDEKMQDPDGEWFKMTWQDASGKTHRSEDNHWFYKFWRAGYHVSVDLTMEAGHYKRVNMALIAKQLFGGWKVAVPK